MSMWGFDSMGVVMLMLVQVARATRARLRVTCLPLQRAAVV
jgi:hypothetical protein